MAALFNRAALADTVYRCGEVYSTYSQCANGAATEVKPTSVKQATEPDKGHTATRDLREAQALENKGCKLSTKLLKQHLSGSAQQLPIQRRGVSLTANHSPTMANANKPGKQTTPTSQQ